MSLSVSLFTINMPSKELKCAFFDENIWSSKYPSIPVPTDLNLSDILLERLTRRGDSEVLIDSETGYSLSGEEVKEISLKIARTLCDLGLEHGDITFGFVKSNCLHSCFILGTLFAGLTYTGCVWSHPLEDLLHQVTDSKAKVVFACKQNVHLVIECAKLTENIKTIILLDDDLDKIESNVKILTLNEIINEPVDQMKHQLPRVRKCSSSETISFIHYSSGSTGLRKGATKTEKAMIYPLLIPNSPFDNCNYGCLTQLAHTSGTCVFLQIICSNSKMIFIDKFDPITFLNCIEKYQITHISLVPSYMVAVSKLNDDQVTKFNLSSLKCVSTFGSLLPNSVLTSFKKKFDPSITIQSIYATTESHVIGFLPLKCPQFTAEGFLYPGVKVRIIDTKSGQMLGPNEVGEIHVQSVDCASCYLNLPRESKEVFIDGWVKTGDIGYFDDDGQLNLVDRIKDVIKVHGCQVPPIELENVLLTSELVKEACVIGIQNDEFGEVPRAFVVPTQEENLDSQKLINLVNSKVAEIKHIRGGLYFINEIPKLGIGKVDRIKLRKINVSSNELDSLIEI